MTSDTLRRAGVALAIAMLATAPRVARAEGPAGPAVAAESASPLATDWLAAAPLFPAASEAPSCRVEDPANRSTAADTGAKLAQIRALLAADAARAGAGSGAGGDVVVLSNRGYNYDADELVDPALIEFEARRRGR